MYAHIIVVVDTRVSASSDGRKKGMKKRALIYNYDCATVKYALHRHWVPKKYRVQDLFDST